MGYVPTTNYGFQKPEKTNAFNVDDLNNNLDKIDETTKSISDKIDPIESIDLDLDASNNLKLEMYKESGKTLSDAVTLNFAKFNNYGNVTPFQLILESPIVRNFSLRTSTTTIRSSSVASDINEYLFLNDEGFNKVNLPKMHFNSTSGYSCQSNGSYFTDLCKKLVGKKCIIYNSDTDTHTVNANQSVYSIELTNQDSQSIMAHINTDENGVVTNCFANGFLNLKYSASQYNSGKISIATGSPTHIPLFIDGNIKLGQLIARLQ